MYNKRVLHKDEFLLTFKESLSARQTLLRMKHIYMVHLDGYIGAFKPDDGFIDYAKREKFVDFVMKLKHKFPEYQMKCVLNEGIQEAIWEKISADRLNHLLINNDIHEIR